MEAWCTCTECESPTPSPPPPSPHSLINRASRQTNTRTTHIADINARTPRQGVFRVVVGGMGDSDRRRRLCWVLGWHGGWVRTKRNWTVAAYVRAGVRSNVEQCVGSGVFAGNGREWAGVWDGWLGCGGCFAVGRWVAAHCREGCAHAHQPYCGRFNIPADS